MKLFEMPKSVSSHFRPAPQLSSCQPEQLHNAGPERGDTDPGTRTGTCWMLDVRGTRHWNWDSPSLNSEMSEESEVQIVVGLTRCWEGWTQLSECAKREWGQYCCGVKMIQPSLHRHSVTPSLSLVRPVISWCITYQCGNCGTSFKQRIDKLHTICVCIFGFGFCKIIIFR